MVFCLVGGRKLCAPPTKEILLSDINFVVISFDVFSISEQVSHKTDFGYLRLMDSLKALWSLRKLPIAQILLTLFRFVPL